VTTNRPDSKYSFSFFPSSYHKITKKTLEMYNPAKMSSTMRASLTSEAEDLNVQNTVSVINIAMHYMFLQLISVLNSIHYTKIKKG